MIILRRIRQSTIAFDWSHHGPRFRIPRKMVKLSKKYQKKDVHYLLACELRKSSIPFSGFGTFLREPAVKNQIIFQYGGRRISFKEADRLACQVIYKEILSKIVFLPLQCRDSTRTWKRTISTAFATIVARLCPVLFPGTCSMVWSPDSPTPTANGNAMQSFWGLEKKFSSLQQRKLRKAKRFLFIIKCDEYIASNTNELLLRLAGTETYVLECRVSPVTGHGVPLNSAERMSDPLSANNGAGRISQFSEMYSTQIGRKDGVQFSLGIEKARFGGD